MTLDSGPSGKVAVVTGGSRGIGRAIVLLFAEEGVDVTFFYRENTAAADDVVSTGKMGGGAAGKLIGNVQAEQVDIRDSAACVSAVDRVVERCGRIDILV